MFINYGILLNRIKFIAVTVFCFAQASAHIKCELTIEMKWFKIPEVNAWNDICLYEMCKIFIWFPSLINAISLLTLQWISMNFSGSSHIENVTILKIHPNTVLIQSERVSERDKDKTQTKYNYFSPSYMRLHPLYMGVVQMMIILHRQRFAVYRFMKIIDCFLPSIPRPSMILKYFTPLQSLKSYTYFYRYSNCSCVAYEENKKKSRILRDSNTRWTHFTPFNILPHSIRFFFV